MTPAAAEKELQLLVFELDGARHGLDLSRVREVVRAVFITPLPGAPAVVEGVVDVRGEVVPVYDLRARFRLPPRALHPDEQLVIAWTGERRVAFRCDRADWLGAVEPESIAHAPRFAVRDDLVTGVVQLADGLVLIQDLAAFLDEAERAALDDALASRGA